MSALIFLGLGLLIAFIIVGIYNKLIRLRNLVKNAFSQIDVQLKRRYDLIPNLVETAKAYMTHEKETLEAVIRARNSAFSAMQALGAGQLDSSKMQNLLNAESLLSQNLSKLLAVAESYPDLKANQNMSQLMEELTSTENKISFARQAYNDSVMEYNNQREVFPNSFIAGMFQFQAMASYEISAPQEKEAVKVSFG